MGFPLIATKVKAHESFLFIEGSLKVENKEHLFDFAVTLHVCEWHTFDVL